MKCPKCKSPDLHPTMIEEYLPAMACTTCHGSLVSLLYYRHWAETQRPASELAATPVSAEAETPTAAAATPMESTPTSDTTTAILCPKCSRVMMKYKITGRVANRLDVCRLCDEAWLDQGEWELLEALQLSHQMPAIFTHEWQKRIRRELTEEARRSMLARMIGERAVEQVDKFRSWLSGSRHKPEIMAYLYRG